MSKKVRCKINYKPWPKCVYVRYTPAYAQKYIADISLGPNITNRLPTCRCMSDSWPSRLIVQFNFASFYLYWQ